MVRIVPAGYSTGRVSNRWQKLRAWKPCALIILTSILTSIGALSADNIVFGPKNYTRGTGKPVEVRDTFRVTRPSGTYTLRIVNHGVTSAIIRFNGRVVFEPDDFTTRKKGDKDDRRDSDRDRDRGDKARGDRDDNDRGDDRVPVPLLTRQVTLRAGSNEIVVELRSKPGTSLTLEIRSDGATDTTPPTITTLVSPPANANGWNNSTVTVTFSCADIGGSGVATCPASAVVSAEGANQVVSGTATDNAGNSATVRVTLNIDKTPPVVTSTSAPPANADGWNRGPVVVTFAAVDALSGVAPGTLSPPQTLSSDGANLSATGHASDLAGNVGTVTIGQINIDQINPTITFALSPPPNANGIVNGPVTIHFTCADTGSGIASCSPNQLINAAGPHAGVIGTATDRAGNSASVTTIPFIIQIGIPTITSTISPRANAFGWNNTPVTVHFTCMEGGYPLDGCPADVVVSTEAANQIVTGTVTDALGNTASITTDPISIDLRVPGVVVALSPSPGAGGWNNSPVTAHFECSDAGSGIATCPADQLVTAQGANLTVTGTATDRAGNTAQVTSDPFRIDSLPPTVTVTFTPTPNANGWNNTPVTAHFTCGDGGSGIATCPADQVFSADGANQAITSAATDVAGNTATPVATVNIDQAPPVLLFARSNVDSVFVPALSIDGTVVDSMSGLRSVTCNGAPATVLDSQFRCDATLTPGANSINATATDAAGNTTSSTLSLTYVRVPKVTITSPANLTYFNISPTTVTGTVDDPTATVTINSIAAPVADGRFSVALPLAEGPNIIAATATVATGAVGTDSVEVTLDTTPPHVTITSPADGFMTTEASISIAGNVNDIVVGTVNDQQAQVTVNGAGAQVANRTFLATTVPLAIGINNIQAVARDRVGNAATTQIIVVRHVPTQPRIRLISGSGQEGVIGTVLKAPLVIELSDGLGNAVPNRPVIFKATQNDGVLTAGGDPAVTVLATTDGQGRAQARWTLGHRAGAGGNVIEAYSVGFEGTAIFNASGIQGTAGKIVVDTGNDQIGAIGQALPKPFIAVVVDDGNNRLAGVPVTFTVQQGGGTFDGQPTFTATSDSDGRVASTLTLGLQEGSANNLVEANFPVNTGLGAAFTASGRAPGNPAETTISGVVLDNSNLPIPGVTVRAVLTNVVRSNLSAVQAATAVQTDLQGQFTIPQAPVGLIKLMIDGTTAQREGTYPSLEYDLVTVAGQKNDVGQPIYLLPLSTANQLCVTATTGGGTLTIPEAPGFSLTFGPGQVTFPGGSKSGCVSVTVVNGDKVPMVPGFGQQPRFIVTIQPSGAAFNPPAPITLPNVDGLRPREVTEMYSFDHDIGSFVAIGTGVVSDDGQVIRSSTGVGVLKAGWHCGGNPNTTGTAANCKECQKCVGTQCVADDTASCDDGRFCTSADGKKPGPDKCDGGSCKGKDIDGDVLIKVEVDFAKIAKIKEGIKKLSQIASTVTKWMPCWIGDVDPSVSLSEEKGTFCCEADKKMAEGNRVSGGGGASIAASCFIGLTSLAPEIPPSLVAAVGIKASGSVGATGTVSDLIGTCKGDQWNESVQVKAALTVSAVIVHVGDIIDAHFEGPQGSLVGNWKAENFLSNIHFTGEACIDGEVKLIVEHFGVKLEIVTFHLFGKLCL